MFVPREMAACGRRVAVTPFSAKELTARGVDVVVAEAGDEAGFRDDDYLAAEHGSVMTTTLHTADIVARVAPLSNDEEAARRADQRCGYVIVLSQAPAGLAPQKSCQQ